MRKQFDAAATRQSAAILSKISHRRFPKRRPIGVATFALAFLTFALCLPTFAQGTAFTYQGQLKDGGAPANGIYDLQFTIHPLLAGGFVTAGPVTNANTSVSNGLFTVSLDCGAGVFTGADRWLEIGVRTNGGGVFTNLAPRQQITATPYAITASNLTGTVAASQLSGAVALANLPTTMLVTNGQTGVNLTGTFSGNGAGVTNVALTNLNSFGALSWPGTFLLTSSPGVGTGPRSVTAADVNADGKADLISANSSGSTLTVLTNNGSGGFVLSSSPGVGSSPYSVVAADVNGDGRVDLISANNGPDTLSVLTNNGSGGFVLSSSPGVGSNPASVTTADVNGDGKVDLISANEFGNTLTVLTNSGSGGFVLSSSPVVGTSPISVTAADVNGDGKMDLICANELFAGTLTVLTNNGSGGFVLSSSPVVGSAPFSVTAADVNGDGKMDLISANFGGGAGNTLTVLFNAPTFTGNLAGNFTGNFPNGNVGIGTISPQAPLHIATAGDPAMFLQDTGDASTQTGFISFRNNNLTETAWLGFGTAASPDFSIVNARSGGDIILSPFFGNVGIRRTPTANMLEVEGNASKTTAGSWLANSDARIKTDVRTVTGALDKLSQVRLVEFHYTDDYRAQHPSLKDRSYLNVVAQEFQNVFPEDVQSSGEKLPGGGDPILQVDTYPLTIYSAAAIQELNQKLEQKETELTELKQRLEKLERLMIEKNGGAE